MFSGFDDSALLNQRDAQIIMSIGVIGLQEKCCLVLGYGFVDTSGLVTEHGIGEDRPDAAYGFVMSSTTLERPLIPCRFGGFYRASPAFSDGPESGRIATGTSCSHVWALICLRTLLWGAG